MMPLGFIHFAGPIIMSVPVAPKACGRLDSALLPPGGCLGIGFDRMRAGSNAVDQYANRLPLSSMTRNLP